MCLCPSNGVVNGGTGHVYAPLLSAKSNRFSRIHRYVVDTRIHSPCIHRSFRVTGTFDMVNLLTRPLV